MRSVLRGTILALALAVLCGLCAFADYMKMDPPPDVDKTFLAGNGSCWLATAANMLAGAGYGTGSTVQARADSIYQQLTQHYGTSNGGWADVAISWWLQSSHNTWSNNPYTVVTVYGHKTRIPWTNADGARYIGNQLRECQMVGLSISWPTNGNQGSGGHAFTAWGDSGGSGMLAGNPASVMTTDSDRDTGGNVQSYDYDGYNNPNPAGPNNGSGWYIDYSNNHPFIKHIVTLCPATWSAYGGYHTQTAVGSKKVHQDDEDPATDLHYVVYTDVPLLSYRTTIDWPTSHRPTITEDFANGRITVDWDLSDNPIPNCTWVTITTEFVLPSYNGVWYDDVHFTYDDAAVPPPFPASIGWVIETPIIEDPETASLIENVSGGYVIGAFDVYSQETGELVEEYRLSHEYDYDQDPEYHEFYLAGDPGYYIRNIRFGHTYGYLQGEELWAFEEWLSGYDEFRLEDAPTPLAIEWEDLLPYPEADGPPPQQGTIEIGTKNFTEQFVVGSLMEVYLEAKGFDVELTTGMSSTVLREAMENGDLDLCMDYTGTQWLTYTAHEFNGESPEEIYELAKESDAEIGLVWLDPIWCNNTYAIAVTREFAETYGVYDLEAFAAYVNGEDGCVSFASDFEFYSRPDGILGLQVHYGFAFRPEYIVTVLPGLTFEYLIQGESVAAMVFGTDPQVVKYDWVVLQDTRNFWPPYDLAPIVNEDTLAANPGLDDALNRLIAAFPTDPAEARAEMTALNAMVDIDLMEPEEAAKQWLEDHDLI